MKRRDAFRKIRTICQRLDDLSEAQVIEFRARPLELYLFGSALTDKPQPGDVDLVLIFDELSELITSTELHRILSYGKPAPFGRLSSHLRRGMKMIRMEGATDTLADWPAIHLFPGAEGIHLVWRPDLDWATILDQLEANPVGGAGPWPREDLEEVRNAWAARTKEEREQEISRILAALDERRKGLPG